ncbi:hypothetical protein [Lactiplantibacillus modestisalitolerans]|uniref:Uncharacterized protein n=1 Tax=Lactiplantibacillus modestisalitolerans TaxID=1457219 RepID=A0ABV5WQV4_9LACO|nr:hypothetical protein [Lactiplantibacillus modestisalitolerans]
MELWYKQACKDLEQFRRYQWIFNDPEIDVNSKQWKREIAACRHVQNGIERMSDPQQTNLLRYEFGLNGSRELAQQALNLKKSQYYAVRKKAIRNWVTQIIKMMDK